MGQWLLSFQWDRSDRLIQCLQLVPQDRYFQCHRAVLAGQWILSVQCFPCCPEDQLDQYLRCFQWVLLLQYLQWDRSVRLRQCCQLDQLNLYFRLDRSNQYFLSVL